jgi:hypothetical protein
MKNVNILEVGSVFVGPIPTDADIEHERQQLEAEYGERLQVFDKEVVTRSGVRCIRVTWQCL